MLSSSVILSPAFAEAPVVPFSSISPAVEREAVVYIVPVSFL